MTLFEWITSNYAPSSQGSESWVGVDLDSTLAYHTSGDSIWTIGNPVPKMQETVIKLLETGYEVRIMTARVGTVTGENYFVSQQKQLIEDWCQEYLGTILPITASKDFRMILLLDDRAVRIKQNEGVPTLLD
jgi:hypothetical protein